MKSFVRATALIARTHFLRALTSRRTLSCVALAFLPALAAFLVTGISARASAAPLFANLGWIMMLQIVVPLVTLIAGSAIVAEEVEDRTITYLFTRPIPRPALMFGRFLSTGVVVSTVLLVGVLLLYLACGRARGEGPPVDASLAWPFVAAVAWGVVVYSAIFASLGAFFRHPMLIGIGYAFAIEGFLANLPGKNQALTVQFYLRSLIAQSPSPSWRGVEGFSSTAFDPAGRAHAVLAVILVVVIALGAWRLARRQFELTS